MRGGASTGQGGERGSGVVEGVVGGVVGEVGGGVVGGVVGVGTPDFGKLLEEKREKGWNVTGSFLFGILN